MMKARTIWSGTILAMIFIVACSGGQRAEEAESQEWSLDERSFNLGAIASMSGVVGSGVKKLGLSAPLVPDEMDVLIDDAIRTAAERNVEIYRETDFLVNDLFSAELTEGKHVLLICHESTFHEYEALKAEKKRLVDAGEYHGEARTDIARRFGKLLSYPDDHIELELTQ